MRQELQMSNSLYRTVSPQNTLGLTEPLISLPRPLVLQDLTVTPPLQTAIEENVSDPVALAFAHREEVVDDDLARTERTDYRAIPPSS